MSNINDNLKDVIERNIDACHGYEKAAEKVHNPRLASTFRDQANQRRQFANELQSIANIQGATSEASGTFEASLHRTWMDIKTALSSDKDEAVLEECIRGEKEALDEYNELVNDASLPRGTSQLIDKQRDTVRHCILDLQRLEDKMD